MTSDPAIGSAERDAFYDGMHQRDPERIEPEVERHPVQPESTNIVSVGWAVWGGGGGFEPRAHQCAVAPEQVCGLLEVEFVGGNVYRYYHVVERVALVMQGRVGMPLKSVGAFFSASVRAPSGTPGSGMTYRRMPGAEAQP